MNTSFISIAFISLGLLFFATLLNTLLKIKNPQNPTFKKVGTIIKTWWLIVTFLLISVGTAPWGLIVGFAGISLLGAREYYRHSRLIESKNLLFLLLAGFILMQYTFLALEKYSVFQVFPILTIIVCLPPLTIFGRGLKQLPEMIASFIGPILSFHFLACLPALYLASSKTWGGPDQALYSVFILIFLTEGNDVFQFLSGKMWGKRKLIPEISPNKTEAGFIGGLLLTTLLGGFLFYHFLKLDILIGAGLAFLISFYGIQGDLFFSAVKRYFGTKDFSDALPGHGGFLDRLDSLILTAPVVFYFFWFLKGGI